MHRILRYLGQAADHLLQPPNVHTNVVCELWVEACPQDVSLPDGNNVVQIAPLHVRRRIRGPALGSRGASWENGQYLHVGLGWVTGGHLYTWSHLIALHLRLGGHQQLLDNRRPDEDAWERRRGEGDGGGPFGYRLCRQERQLDVRHKALDLAAEVVAVDANVQAANEFLAALLGGVGLLGKQDEAGTGAPGWFLRTPFPSENLVPSWRDAVGKTKSTGGKSGGGGGKRKSF